MAQRLRAPLALILGVLAVLFTVLSIDARMVRGLVLDTDRFVAVLGPTIDDPEVQLALSGAIADGVVDHLPQTDLTRWLPDAAGARVGETAREVIGSVVRDQTQTLLSSDGAQAVWDTSLRVSHAQISATLSGKASAAVVLNEDRLFLNLTPVWEGVRGRLGEIGIPAALLPERTVTIDLADGAGVAAAQSGVRLLNTVATWLLPIGLLALAGCVVVARRRRFAGYWLAAAIGLISAAQALVFALAPRLLAGALGDSGALLRGVVRRALGPSMWTYAVIALLCVGVVAGLIWEAGRRSTGPIDQTDGAPEPA